MGLKQKLIKESKQYMLVCMCGLYIFNNISVCSYSWKLYSWVKNKSFYMICDGDDLHEKSFKVMTSV